MTAARQSALPLAVSVIVLSLTYWCVDIVSPALPTIRDSLSLSATGAGLVFSIFFAGRLVTNLPAAWLAERAGPKWAAATGAGVLLLGSALAGSAVSELPLLAARGVQGAGVAVLATAGLLSLLRMRPRSGAAMTGFNVASGVGTCAGLLSGGYLATDVGWRGVFLLSALVAGSLLTATLFARAREAAPRAQRPSDDAVDPSSRTPRFAEAAAVAANLLVYGNYAVWIVSLPLLGALKFGFNASQVGLMLLFVNLVHMSSAVPIGKAIRMIGAARALTAGFAIVSIGMLLIPFAPDVPWLLAPMALYSIGQLAGNSSAGDLILRLGGGGGRAVGAVRLSSDIGLVVGPAAAGALTDIAGVEAPFFVLGMLTLAVMTVSVAIELKRRSRVHIAASQ